MGVITLVTATHELLQIGFLAWWSQYALRFFGRFQTGEEAQRFYRTENAILLLSVFIQSVAIIGILLETAQRLCVDVARLTEEQWAAVDSDTEDAALTPIRESLRTAVLYALGYLFEHREDADHHELTLTLRSLLFAVREGVV